MTDAERRIWFLLRRHQMKGYNFRRQAPIGPYIVDFACLALKLIVELDGGQHAERIAQDEQRSEYLRALGFRVLRFWNNDALGNTDGVLEVIMRAVDEAAQRRGLPSP
jgi:very-short-patch-repair endonuclease